jgi:D-alanine-D-alanine ligase
MRVVVLMGGSSTERDISLATGAGVADALAELGHEVVALDPATGKRIEIAEAKAHQIGTAPGSAPGDERSLVLAGNELLQDVDMIFVALHGGIGENGRLQAVLDLAGTPYTGSGMLASAMSMDKALAKTMFRAAGIPTPRGRLLTRKQEIPDPDALGGFPLVVKPNAQGSSVAVHIVQGAETLEAALEDAFQYGPVLMEEFIPGRELTVAVLGGKALPVVEILPEDGFYDYRHKYTRGETNYKVPAELSESVAREVERLAEIAFGTLGCAGVARIDFRLTEEGNAFCLEVNTIPGMTATSLVPMAAKAADISYPDLVARILELGKARHERRTLRGF